MAIVVPCGQEMSAYERFHAAHAFRAPIIFFGFHIFLSLIDFLLRTISDRIRCNPRRIQLLQTVLSLCVLRCILSTSLPNSN